MKLQEKYKKEIIPALAKELGIKNIMAVPKMTKIVVNMGIGDVLKNKEGKASLIADMATITGQQPSQRKAKISVASFSVRKGMIVGLSSTLRGVRMYDFFEKFVNIVLPRLRDFRGVKTKSFDNFGNYTVGIADHSVFPEIDTTKSTGSHGVEITIATTAKNKKEGEKLLELMGMPFVKK